MAAVAAEDLVLNLQRECLSDCCRFLADREVSWAGVDVGHALVGAFPFDRVEHQLELAYQQHVSADAVQRFVAVQLPFVIKVRLVGVDWNRAKLEFSLGPNHCRVDEELFCHSLRGPLGGGGNGHSAESTSTVSMQLAISTSTVAAAAPSMAR